MYKHTIATLTDQQLTTTVLVCRADSASLDEAARTSVELTRLGIDNQQLVINGVYDTASEDAIALAWKSRTRNALSNMPENLAKLERVTAPLLPFSPLGVENLRHLWHAVNGESVLASDITPDQSVQLPPSLPELFADILQQGKGVIMTMGKGGVGKTTIATELAKFLTHQGHEVLLATTDPASHLDFSLSNRLKNLTVARIDPKEEIRKYTDKVMSEAGSQLDEQGRKLLEEDLRSPCTEEIAVFQAFAQIVHQGKDKFIVLDTAPTGHTLLLMDAARAYHREVERTTQQLPEEVTSLLPRMRDREYTKVIVVTLPELTPVQEALQLEDDLKRAAIISYAWVINQSLAPLTISDPLLKAKQLDELPYIQKLMERKGVLLYLAEWDLNIS
jgi:arsenite-transporting ATPase